MGENKPNWCSKFTDAISDLREVSTKIGQLETPQLDQVRFGLVSMMHAKGIHESPRFYIPNAAKVLTEKPAPYMYDVLSLPYPRISILYETFWEGAEKKPTWGIVVVSDERDKEREDFFKSVFKDAPKLGKQFFVTSACIAHDPRLDRPRWSILPCFGIVTFEQSMGQPLLGTVPCLDAINSEDHVRITQELGPDSDALLATCVLVNLKNSNLQTVSPSKKLNKKREKNGKLPLLDYHVLEIGGHVWDSPHESTGTGPGKRSHMRRGHIRRCQSGLITWVSSCVVHGRKPGWVDKDYMIGVK